MTRLQSLLSRCRHTGDVKKLQRAIPELRGQAARTVEWLWVFHNSENSAVDPTWPVDMKDVPAFAAWLREEV